MKMITCLTYAFTSPFLSSLEHCRQPENIIAILNLFSVQETSCFNCRREVFDICDHELAQHYDVYAIKAADKILYTRRNGIKKWSIIHSNNKERCSAGLHSNVDDLL